MARPERRTTIADVRVLSALAHPVRLAVLRHLMAVGPRTASECAEVVGASASNCSYHLRHLARHGLVEPAAADDGRERPWQAAVTGFDVDPSIDGDPVRAALVQALSSAQVEENARLARDFLRRTETLDEQWRDAADLMTYGLLIGPDELRRLIADVDRLIRPYIGLTRADAGADARPVHITFDAFPVAGEQR